VKDQTVIDGRYRELREIKVKSWTQKANKVKEARVLRGPWRLAVIK
jgi:hypothetical protein